MEKNTLSGTKTVQVKHKDMEFEFWDVPFSGWHEFDPGVRYYPDGSGDPPSTDGEVVCDWVPEDVTAYLKQWFKESDLPEPDWVMTDAAEILEKIELALGEKVLDVGIEDHFDEPPETW